MLLCQCRQMRCAYYLPEVATLTVLHGQQRHVVGGHQLLHALGNLAGCNHVDVIQPEQSRRSTI